MATNRCGARRGRPEARALATLGLSLLGGPRPGGGGGCGPASAVLGFVPPPAGPGAGLRVRPLLVQPFLTDPLPDRYSAGSSSPSPLPSLPAFTAAQLEEAARYLAGQGAAATAAHPRPLNPQPIPPIVPGMGGGSEIERQAPLAPSGGEGSGRVTLTRFLNDAVQERPELRGMDLPLLSVQLACKTISNLVNRAGINQLTKEQTSASSSSSSSSAAAAAAATSSSSSASGSEQADYRLNSMKRLDQLSTNVLRNALRFTGKLRLAVPGKAGTGGDPSDGPDRHQPGVLIASAIDGRYVACFDPLDGSGNADAAICTGTVFGLFENPDRRKGRGRRRRGGGKGERGGGGGREKFALTSPIPPDPDALAASVLQPGKNLRGAGYCLYSSATILVFTLGDGPVNGFTLDPQSNEFVLTHPDIRIPPRGNVYSCNEANSEGWTDDVKGYIRALKTGANRTGRPYTLRYVGSMCGDIHRTLMYGGVFCYPGDDIRHPQGNLQLLYKLAPMAKIISNAGGMATDGRRDLLDIKPSRVHERSPCFIGSPDDIAEMKDSIPHPK